MRGCIVKRGPKSWAVKVYLGRDPQTGKDRQKWFSYRRREDAEKHLAQLLTQIHGGATIAITRQRVAEYLEDWRRGHEPHVAPTTAVSYRDTIRKHLAPVFGHVPLPRLSPQAIRDYITQKLAAGLSETTVRYHVFVLHEALQQAVRDGLLARNPCDLVQAPRKLRPQMQVLDEEQVRLFLAEAKRSSPHYRLYLAALTTGMRQGELLGLRWRDLELTLGVASIQQTFYRLGGSKRDGRPTQQLFKAPKTDRARRPVALPSMLVEELRVLRTEQQEQRRLFGSEYAADLDLVFCQPNGKPLHGHNVTRRDLQRVLELRGMREEARSRGVPENALPKGLPRIRFHDLRHCHATLLLQQGVHPKVVQERLGHSTISMTLDTYSHVVPGMQEQAVQNLQSRLFGIELGSVTLP